MFKKLFHKCIPTDCQYIIVEKNKLILAKCMICGKSYMYIVDNNKKTYKKRISKASYENAKKIYKEEGLCNND